MNGITDDDKITHARDLLKKFQSKQHRNARSSITNSINDSDETGAVHSQSPLNHNGSILQLHSSCNESTCNEEILHVSRGSSTPTSSIGGAVAANDLLLIDNSTYDQFRCHSIPKSISEKGQMVEVSILRNSLKEKENELTDAFQKLQSLQKHYTNLHSAYTHLASKKSPMPEAEIPPAYIQQVHQLQTALASSLDEKTALQAELRVLKTRLETFIASQKNQLTISSSQSSIASNTNDNIESRLNKILAEKQILLETISKQCIQIEQQRKECSELEAKWVLIQQDRLDTQARLKSIFEEKTQVEHSLERLKQEIKMRDIYLRQLTCHNNTNSKLIGSDTSFDQAAIDLDNKKHFEEVIQQYKNELSELNKQIQTAKQHYQDATNQANTRIQLFENEVCQLRSEKAELECANGHLEEQLRIAQQENSQNDATSEQNKNMQPSLVDPSAIIQLKQQLSDLVSMKEKAYCENDELTKLIESKNSELDFLKKTLAEAERRTQELEQQRNIQSTISMDAITLSEQLQNEKATVSRAVSQNLELKAQLTELQDRLIEVINESAVKEDERVTALVSVARLTQLLNEKNSHEQQHFQPEESVNQLQLNETLQTVDKVNDHSIGIQTDQFENEESENFAVIANSYSNETKSILKSEKNCESELEKPNEYTLDVCNEVTPDENISTKIEENQQQLYEEQLEQRMDQLFKENQRYRMDNEKLQYWMTALESENESIGEYIALYRFQRGNIQKRIAEKDQQVQKLKQQNTTLMAQLAELHNSTVEYLHGQAKKQQLVLSEQQYRNQTAIEVEENNQENVNTLEKQLEIGQPIRNEIKQTAETAENELKAVEPCDIVQANFEHKNSLDQSGMQRLVRALERSKILGNEAMCSAAQEAQIHCTGCIECRGEMFTL